MRGLRPFGLVALYIGAQLTALALAFPFLSAGLSSTSNPNAPSDPIYIIVVIIAAPLFLLWLVRFRGALATLRTVLLLAIGASLDVTVTAALGVLLPSPSYLPPFGPSIAVYVSLPLGAAVAVAAFLALL